jgi:D-serine deaminase-like pyridoxal phosphate-dependent protein
MFVKPSLNIAWVQTAILSEVPSPAVVIGLDAVDQNIKKMLAMAGSAQRLRPHVKTHKMPQLVQRQIALGITRFKCATIAEAEMCARAGAAEALIAYQMVGPNIARFLALQKKYPATKFSTTVDDAVCLCTLAAAAKNAGTRVEVLIDLDVGQHRTGIAPGVAAMVLYRELAGLPSIIAGGLHAYDGHLSQEDAAIRKAETEAAFVRVFAMRDELLAMKLPVPRIVAGGSPTFPFHAANPDVECSPGTIILWDASSAMTLPDMDFQNAAVLLTRVISKPMEDLLCLDLGHKAVASEMPHPRVIFPELPGAEAVKHSEEHLLLRTPLAGNYAVGDILVGVPWHVCPTVALHGEVVVVENGRLAGTWPVEARARRISV